MQNSSDKFGGYFPAGMESGNESADDEEVVEDISEEALKASVRTGKGFGKSGDDSKEKSLPINGFTVKEPSLWTTEVAEKISNVHYQLFSMEVMLSELRQTIQEKKLSSPNDVENVKKLLREVQDTVHEVPQFEKRLRELYKTLDHVVITMTTVSAGGLPKNAELLFSPETRSPIDFQVPRE